MSTRANLKQKYRQTKIALSNTIQQLLDINRKRRKQEDHPARTDLYAEEIRILNATAENQARILRAYEQRMAQATEEAA